MDIKRECALGCCTLLFKRRFNRNTSPGGSYSGTMAAWICNRHPSGTIVRTKRRFIYTEDCTKNNMPIYGSRYALFPCVSKNRKSINMSFSNPLDVIKKRSYLLLAFALFDCQNTSVVYCTALCGGSPNTHANRWARHF